MRGESNSLLDGLVREEETSSNSSTEVQGDTDERTENANYSVDIEQVPVRVEPVEAFTNLEAEQGPWPDFGWASCHAAIGLSSLAFLLLTRLGG